MAVGLSAVSPPCGTEDAAAIPHATPLTLGTDAKKKAAPLECGFEIVKNPWAYSMTCMRLLSTNWPPSHRE